MNAYKYSTNYLYFQSCEFDPDVIRDIKDPIFGTISIFKIVFFVN